MKLKMVLLFAFAVTLFSSSAGDGVIMTVNGEKINRSEFEYLYRKSCSQLPAPLSVAEYMDMFTTYRLKLAHARELGLDTVPEFIEDIARYRKDLSESIGNEESVEFHNLMKEYYDGSLLYEASVMMVWDKASKDKVALLDFFNRNKEKYCGNVPGGADSRSEDSVLVKHKDKVIYDFQDYLEREWIGMLGKKYTVKVNKKEVRKVK